MPKALTDRPSEPRHGYCGEDADLYDETRHIENMNKFAQKCLGNPRFTHFPYYDKVEFDEQGKLRLPPPNHRLSDTLVFLIIAQNAAVARHRHAKWEADFDSAGDIYQQRWPMGAPVILWAFGVPFVAVYANYYVMAGSLLRPYTWLLTKKKSHAQLAPSANFHFGEIVAPPHKLAVDDPANSYQVNYDESNWANFAEPMPMLRCDPAKLILTYHNGALKLTRITNIRAFNLCSGSTRKEVLDAPADIDEATWEALKSCPYVNATALVFSDKSKLRCMDYNSRESK